MVKFGLPTAGMVQADRPMPMERVASMAFFAEVLEGRGMKIRHPFVGNYFTSLEMMGVTLTVMRLDAELDRLIGAPARCVGLTKVMS